MPGVRSKITITYLILSVFSISLPGWAIEGRVSFSASQYAQENMPTSRAEIDATLKDGGVEARLRSFVESGESGDRSIDLDPVVLRLKQGAFWVGRAHPAAEALGIATPLPTSAIGTNWAQNQSDALRARVSGWIGLGGKLALLVPGLSVSASYSPIFLPNFGPSLVLSESESMKGARFVRLPPSYVLLSPEAPIPLRYRVQIGDLSEILFQNQFFTSLSYEVPALSAALLAWSAPSPDPRPETSAVLRIREKTLDALITAKPHFPRQRILGSRLGFKSLAWTPELQATFETESRDFTVSLAAAPARFFEFGVLHRMRSREEEFDYARGLTWLEGRYPISSRMETSLRLEQHLGAGREDRWLLPTLRFQPEPDLSFFVRASILTGTEASYFGTWRAQDSVAMGGVWTW